MEYWMTLHATWVELKFNEMQIGGEDIGNLFRSMLLEKNKKKCIQSLFHTIPSYL
jgi:hypothetical protein